MWSENSTEIKYSYTKSLVLESISHSTLLTPHSSKTKYFQIILFFYSLIRSLASPKILTFEKTQNKFWFFTHLFVSLHTDNKSSAIAEDQLLTKLYQYGRLPGG